LKGNLVAHWGERAAIAVVLIVGVWQRLGNLGLVRHTYDNSYQIYDAVRLLDGRQWLIIGQSSSVFLDNPPLMGYLQTLPLLLERSPWGGYILVALLNTLAIWFVYRIVRELLDRPSAVLAAALFAFSPWIIFFSRQTWTQGLFPFFMALMAWGLWSALVEEKPRPFRLWVGLLALTGLTQTYILAFALIFPVGLLCLHQWRRLPQRPLWGGLAIFAFSLMAFGIGLWHNAERNIDKLVGFTGGENGN
jgi:4-amino-4-deoxy-L-arabinose transferase-like glycosyltransferase